MNIRTATCQCGQLRANCNGEPVRVSVCHCLDCQKRSGSAFAAQARWPDTHVTLTGESKTFGSAGLIAAIVRPTVFARIAGPRSLMRLRVGPT